MSTDLESSIPSRIDPRSMGILWVDAGRPTRWALFRPTRAPQAREERSHALLERHVGTHGCFHPQGRDAEEPPRRLADLQAIGGRDEAPTAVRAP